MLDAFYAKVNRFTVLKLIFKYIKIALRKSIRVFYSNY